jgi:mono/diheme cytochrome c family protein
MIKNKRVMMIVISLAILVMVLQINGVLGQAGKTSTEMEQIKRGEYLVEIGGCNDCHSPKKFTEMGPVPDENRLLSGHPQNLALPKIDPSLIGPGKWVLMNDNLTATVGPWGVSFAANLTPDNQTGIGLWKESNFIQALRTGKHMGAGRPILPPMPWFNLAKATDEDLKAIFAYLKSLKPIRNAVPAPIPPNELTK